MTGYDSKRQMAADKVLDLDGHVVGKVRKPKRKWVGLTNEEAYDLLGVNYNIFAIRAIEKALQEKNT